MFLRRLFGVEQAPKKPEPKQEQQQQLSTVGALIHLDPFDLLSTQIGYAAQREEMISGTPDFSPGQQG